VNNPENEPEFDPFENDLKKKKSGSSSAGIAWLALLLGLAAIAFNAYQWWQARSADPEDRSRELAIEDLQRTQSAYQQSLDTLQGRLSSAEQKDDSGAFAAIRSDLQSIQSRLSELGLSTSDDRTMIEATQVLMMGLNQRISDLETSVAALAVRSDTPGKKMDLAEVDYLLRMAGERLALFGDARSADQALGLADSQLEALDDPLYLPVRRSIGESRQALQALPSPDRVHLSGQIAALQTAVATLPFPGETPVDVLVTDQVDVGLWQRIKNALAPLIKVRRRVKEDMVLSLEDKDYLRQGVWLRLEAARLALMRNDPLAWTQSLNRARDGISSRFDPASKEVTEAVTGIGQLLETELVQEMPDITAPWRRLQLLREGGAGSEVSSALEPEVLTHEIPVSTVQLPENSGAENAAEDQPIEDESGEDGPSEDQAMQPEDEGDPNG